MNSHILALGLLLGSSVAGFQNEPTQETRSPICLPGGVTDAAGKVVYLTDHGLRIVAVNAEDGELLWENVEVCKPLALVGGQLVALEGGTGTFRIVVLDAGTGKRLQESDPVSLSMVVKAGLDYSGEGSYFETRAGWIDGGVSVKWTAGRYFYGGTIQIGEHPSEHNRRAVGIVNVALDPFRVEMLPDDGKPASAPVGRGQAVNQLPARVQELAERERWLSGCVIGKRAYGLTHEPPGMQLAGGARRDIVHAVDLETGKLVWKRTYNETTFMPPPP